MGNHKFRLSDMMPNAWFYKLKDMGRTKNQIRNKKKQQQTDPSNSNQPHPNSSYPRKSYYFSRELVSHDKFCHSPKSPIDPPRKSSKRIRSRKLAASAAAPARASPKTVTVTSPVSTGCSCRATLRPSCSSDGENGLLEIEDEVPNFPPEFRTDRILTTDSFDDMVAWSRSESDAKDIVIDVKRIELPPIITKSEKFDDSVKDLKKKESPKHYRNSCVVAREERIPAKEQRNSTTTARKSTSSSPRVKLRINSPKIANRKIQSRKSASSRRSLSESLAVVKSSADPQKDFRESMVEMIVQNNLRASKDLEDLLACYLTLNSDEYHEIIIKVFKQIWFDLSDHVQIK